MDLRKLLEQIKSGDTDIESALQSLKNLPYEDMDFAKIDHHRRLRSGGFSEVIFCSGKSDEHLTEIYRRLSQNGTDVFGTRASYEQYLAVSAVVPEVTYDKLSRVLKIVKNPVPKQGLIAVCTGGTSDIPVAEEAAQTAEFFGSTVERIFDVGVAGIHRLFSRLDTIKSANCIVAVAGMEGALPGVLAGLVDKPVIAVPTSIGYGANFGGLSSLLTMLNSCAEGITVVNIDNGFGAGYSATQINKLINKGELK